MILCVISHTHNSSLKLFYNFMSKWYLPLYKYTVDQFLYINTYVYTYTSYACTYLYTYCTFPNLCRFICSLSLLPTLTYTRLFYSIGDNSNKQ